MRTPVSAAAMIHLKTVCLVLYLDLLVLLLLLVVPYCIYGNKLPRVQTPVQAVMCSCCGHIPPD